MASLDADEAEQAALRDRSFKAVQERGFYLRQAADAANFDDVVREAVLMLKELSAKKGDARASELTPKFYYELYMEILNEMRYVETFFVTTVEAGRRSATSIYEAVQATAAIVPRLYLLVTAGSVVMRLRERPNHEVLKDLVDMCKGVQHPTRGLFLRNYLTMCTRDKLPDSSSDAALGTVKDGYEFVLQNFGETNRLWVRLQHQGAVLSKQKRFRIRQDLRMLVGQNIDRLARLEGVGVTEYREIILPKILEHVIKCRDVLAQGYLMDIIIQVFPDDFHFATLTDFLDVVPRLKDRVNVRTILESLMKRLSAYVVAGREASQERLPKDTDAFAVLNDTVTRLLEERRSMKLTELLRLQGALLDFCMKCYPSNLEYVNHVLGTSVQVLDAQLHPRPGVDAEGNAVPAAAPTVLGEEAMEHVERLLSVPLEKLALRVLQLSQYSLLLDVLPWENRRAVAVSLVRAVLAAGSPIGDVERIDQLFTLLVPLLRDPTHEEAAADPSAAAALQLVARSAEGDATGDEDAQSSFEAEQLLIARMVHLMRSDDAAQLHAMYLRSRRSFGLGGVRRIQYTLVPLVFGELQLIPRLRDAEAETTALRTRASEAQSALAAFKEDGPDKDKAAAEAKAAEAAASARQSFPARKGFQFIHEIVTAMAPSYPETALKLFLQAAVSADRMAYTDIGYEFMTQAFIIYEEMLSDSRAHVRVLQAMIGTMLLCLRFEAEDFDSIVTNLAQHCATLLKKPDQCRMVSMVSHLFWTGAPGTEGANCDGRRVLECLQRALKIADVCMASSMNVHLFVEILNDYIFYFEADVSDITASYLSGLIELIKEHLENMEPGPARTAVQTHFSNSIEHIKHQQQLPDTAAKFRDVEV